MNTFNEALLTPKDVLLNILSLVLKVALKSRKISSSVIVSNFILYKHIFKPSWLVLDYNEPVVNPL